MEQAVEDRGGEDVVTEDRAPLRHDLVRGDQQAAAFVPTGDELEKEMRAASFKGQVAKLVDDQQLRLRVEHQAVAQLSIGFGFGQGRQVAPWTMRTVCSSTTTSTWSRTKRYGTL